MKYLRIGAHVLSDNSPSLCSRNLLRRANIDGNLGGNGHRFNSVVYSHDILGAKVIGLITEFL
jgi:hypothetical protein